MPAPTILHSSLCWKAQCSNASEGKQTKEGGRVKLGVVWLELPSSVVLPQTNATEESSGSPVPPGSGGRVGSDACLLSRCIQCVQAHM